MGTPNPDKASSHPRFRLYSPADGVALALVLLAVVLSLWCKFQLDLEPLGSWEFAGILYGSTALMAVVLFAIEIVTRFFVDKGPVKAAALKVLARYNLRRTAWEVLKAVAVFQAITVIWTNLQVAIPAVNPGLYDDAFVGIDRVLFFGYDPVYEISHSAFFSSPALAHAFDIAYLLWYPIKIPVITYLLLCPSLKKVREFTFAFAGMWLLHIVLAMIWPSLGPCFVHPEWFDKLAMPFAHNLQAEILTGYQAFLASPDTFSISMYEGMSAFPSLHVGLVVLYACALWDRRRVYGIIMGVFALIIFFDSGYTGWHYLIDGIAGGAMAVVLFFLAKRIPQGAGEARPEKATIPVEAVHGGGEPAGP